jgi:anti-sigma factor RsiW
MVLSCIDLTEDLSSFVDGELDEHRQTALAEHISACSTCQSSHDTFKNVGKLLHGQNARVQGNAPDLWTAMSLRMPSVCECVQEDLSAYLDGELIAPAKEGVAQHLDSCADCLNMFNQLSKVNGLLSKGLVLPESIEVDIWSQVNARLGDDCVLIRSELSPFIDREVATLRHRTITQHLTECGDCKDDFYALAETGDVLRSSYQPEIPADFDLWPAIQAGMKVIPLESREIKDNVRPIRSPSRRLQAVAAAVVGVAACAAFFLFNHSQSGSQVPPVTAEAYLIDQSLGEPTDVAEAVVYDHQP